MQENLTTQEVEEVQEEQENGSRFKSLFLMLTFFLITPIVLGTTAFAMFSFDKGSTESYEAIYEYSEEATRDTSGVSIYASLPKERPAISGSIGVADARCEIVRQYLEDHNSPLEESACTLVEAADEYGLDWRLLTAIAQKESGLCRVIPPGSHNCWGWGIYGTTVTRFSSFDEAIYTVSNGLKTNYIDRGYTTVEEIMTKYAHPDSTTWADGVNFYLEQLQ